MPRPRFSDWIILPTPVTIDPSGSYTLLLSLEDTFYPQIFYKAIWAVTAGTTGMSLKIYRGYAVNGSGTIEYTDDGTTVTVTNQPTISTTNQTTRNDFALDPTLYPKRLKLIFRNLDATNPCTLFVSGDR